MEKNVVDSLFQSDVSKEQNEQRSGRCFREQMSSEKKQKRLTKIVGRAAEAACHCRR